MTERAYDIEQASLEELDLLATLFDEYRQFYLQKSDVDGAQHFIKERLTSSESVIFIAKSREGLGLGFTQLYPMFSSVRLKRVWVLNDLYVAESARKLGVANGLMLAAEEWGRSQGAVGLELATAKDNAAAKSVYEARGWALDNEFDHYSITL